jgi:multisubunit Na+/H+ antiporter MnhG subunit
MQSSHTQTYMHFKIISPIGLYSGFPEVYQRLNMVPDTIYADFSLKISVRMLMVHTIHTPSLGHKAALSKCNHPTHKHTRICILSLFSPIGLYCRFPEVYQRLTRCRTPLALISLQNPVHECYWSLSSKF